MEMNNKVVSMQVKSERAHNYHMHNCEIYQIKYKSVFTKSHTRTPFYFSLKQRSATYSMHVPLGRLSNF